MATTTITFADNDQITSAKLNQIISGLSFNSGDITGGTLAVVAGQLKVGTITSSEMGALSVATGSLMALSVTTPKIALGAVTEDQLGNFSVTSGKIAAGIINYGHLESSLLATNGQMENEGASYLVSPDKVKRSPGAAKAYGEFNITGTGRTIKANSVNVASLTRIDSTHTTVTLTTNMNSVNYTVLVSGISDGTEDVSAFVYDKAAGSFKIRHSVEASSRAINFVVFGQYA
jgi:hypothetical protein